MTDLSCLASTFYAHWTGFDCLGPAGENTRTCRRVATWEWALSPRPSDGLASASFGGRAGSDSRYGSSGKSRCVAVDGG